MQLSSEDQLRLNVLVAQPLQAVRIDESRMCVHVLSEKGVPILTGTLARFECRTHQIHDCGDHYIIVGEIEDYRFNAGNPLLFFGGEYARLDQA